MTKRSLLALALILAAPALARAEFPYPTCGGPLAPACTDPADYESYLFLPTTDPPTIPSDLSATNFRFSSLVDPAVPATAQELFGVRGPSVDKAWQVTTGRPDVVLAILDSGIEWHDVGDMGDLADKVHLNAAELPLPEAHDQRLRPQRGRRLQRPRLPRRRHARAGQPRQRSERQRHHRSRGPDQDLLRRHRRRRQRLRRRHRRLGLPRGRQRSLRRRLLRPRHRRGRGLERRGGERRRRRHRAERDVHPGQGRATASSRTSTTSRAASSSRVDSGAAVIQEANGSLDNTPFAQHAIDYAYGEGRAGHRVGGGRGVVPPQLPVELQPHDPGELDPRAGRHVRAEPDVSAAERLHELRRPQRPRLDPVELVLVGGDRAGLRHRGADRRAGAEPGRPRSARRPHPVTGTALSANEVKQILAATADDIDFSGNLALSTSLEREDRVPLRSRRRRASRRHAGRDKYFGYGRVNADAAVRAALGDDDPARGRHPGARAGSTTSIPRDDAGR